MRDADLIFNRIKKTLDAYNKFKGFDYEIGSGHSGDELKSLVSNFNVDFPDEYIESLRFFDGFDVPLDLDFGLEVGSLPFVGVCKVDELKEINDEFAEELRVSGSIFLGDSPKIIGPTKIPADGERVGDVIIFATTSSFFWYFDLNPLPGGRRGQIVCSYLMPGESVVCVVADGFHSFIELIANELEKILLIRNQTT